MNMTHRGILPGPTAKVLKDQRTSALRQFHTALARRATAPCDILCVGDSITEGEAATAVTNRWTDKFLTALRAKYSVTGGAGFIPPANQSSTYTDTRVTVAGSPTYVANYGYGLHGTMLTGTGQSITLTVQCSAVDILYERGGGGTFKTTVDTVDRGDTATTGGVTALALRAPDISTSASHTVKIDWVSGNCIILGFMVYDGDTTTGIRMWNGSHGGSTAGEFATYSRWEDATPITAPDLVIVSLGANDCKTSVPLATYKASMQTVITRLKALAPSASYVMLIEHAISSVPSLASWQTFVDAQYELAASNSMQVVDLFQAFGLQAPPTAPGMIHTDNAHPTDAGYQFIADVLMRELA